MKFKHLYRIFAILLCITLVATIIPANYDVSAASLSELRQQQKDAQNNLKKLKDQKAAQDKIKNGLDKQIAATQAIIDQYNAKISGYNSQISEKQSEIDKMNEKIADDKQQFKKRIRSIYMSNTKSNVQILLGAENFSDYLVLAQMAKSVSAHDKALIDNISSTISEIEKEQEEIKVLLDEQKAAKAEVDKEKAALDKQVAEVNSVIKDLKRDIDADTAALKKISDEIDKKTAPVVGGGGIASSNGILKWPSASFFYISAGYNSGDSVHNGNHKGIDIAGSGIKGTPILASASGTVYSGCNSCTHNYNKSYSCGCGGGYGNYVAIDHGNYNGHSYKTLYAHMTSTAVSVGQTVKQGQVIGYVGTTGWSTGPHIHFETIYDGVKVNPKRFFNF